MNNIILYLFCVQFRLALHEIGHLIGGIISGYQFLFIQIGFLCIYKNSIQKFSINFSYHFKGQCVMIPPDKDTCPFRRYNLGGIIADLALSIIGICGLIQKESIFYDFFLLICLVSLPKLLCNCLPIICNGVPTDGYIFIVLSMNKYVVRDYRLYLKLYSLYFQNLPVELKMFVYDRKSLGKYDSLIYYNAIQELLKCIK